MKKLDNIKINNKNIIFRADLNVPVTDGKITDYSRINSIVPSLQKLLVNKNKVFIISHFGRPNGKVDNNYSLKFLCNEFQEIFKKHKVHFLSSFEKNSIDKKIKEINQGEICLFENIRFNPEEEANDMNFAKDISSSFDIYINEAFSASHRKHASIVGIPKFLTSVAGISLSKEIENLNKFLVNAKKPNLAIIGGSKISTKIKLIYKIVSLFDTVVIGGAMANTFLLSNDIKVGNSIVEKNHTEVAKDIQIKAKINNCKLILPIDFVGSKNLKDKNIISRNINNVSDDLMILDIGSQTSKLISNEILRSRSILWNGPLGAFEFKPFEKSSIYIANRIKEHSKQLQIDTMVGGGDTLSVINMAKANDGFKYLSNAGGAFLEWLEGNKSPGVIALEENDI